MHTFARDARLVVSERLLLRSVISSVAPFKAATTDGAQLVSEPGGTGTAIVVTASRAVMIEDLNCMLMN